MRLFGGGQLFIYANKINKIYVPEHETKSKQKRREVVFKNEKIQKKNTETIKKWLQGHDLR